jgi:hypothetical protein
MVYLYEGAHKHGGFWYIYMIVLMHEHTLFWYFIYVYQNPVYAHEHSLEDTGLRYIYCMRVSTIMLYNMHAVIC